MVLHKLKVCVQVKTFHTRRNVFSSTKTFLQKLNFVILFYKLDFFFNLKRFYTSNFFFYKLERFFFFYKLKRYFARTETFLLKFKRFCAGLNLPFSGGVGGGGGFMTSLPGQICIYTGIRTGLKLDQIRAASLQLCNML